MTLLERLAELRLHLAHPREIRPRVGSAADLQRDLSLRNDVLHSLQIVCQVVIDAAGDLAARAGLPFEDYSEAIRSLPRAGPFARVGPRARTPAGLQKRADPRVRRH